MVVETSAGVWDELLDGPGRAILEGEGLPSFLPRQRWFAGKARTIQAVKIQDQTDPSGPLPPQVRFCLLEVGFTDGRSEIYFAPLGIATDAVADRLRDGGAGRVIVDVPRIGLVYDALGDPEVGAILLAEIGRNRSISTQGGVIRGEATSAYSRVCGPAGHTLAVKAGSFEQSNSAIVFGDRLILKIFRRLEPGINPDFEIGKFFAEKTKFSRVPTTAGSLIYAPHGREPMMVGMLQGLIANEGTGWDHALQVLADFYESIGDEQVDQIGATRCPLSVRDQIQWEPGAEVRALVGGYLDDAATLGRRTAEMHLALASDPISPNFRPEPLTSFDLMHLSEEIHGTATAAATSLKASSRTLPAANQPAAETFLDGVDALLRRVDTLAADSKMAVSKIRCHGDYHLGQVLRAGNDYVLLDFEGEPAKSLAERLAKQSALKDVAGMIRSFDYAAFAALFAHTQDHPDRFHRLAPVAQFWRSWVAAAYLREYLAVAGDASFIPRGTAALSKLLEVQLLDKALYELLYELNNRPAWVRIPLQGINVFHAPDQTSSRTPIAETDPGKTLKMPAKLEVASTLR